LVQDDRIRVISFTGSTNTGKELTKIAGIKKLHLELGGQDPAIVLADADLELASKRIAKGVTSFSGQRCDAIRLILVEGSVYQKFKELLMKEILRYKLGDPRNEENQMGPLIREKVAEFIDELVKDAIRKGAKVLIGGKRNGAYYEPTLLEISKEKLHELRAFNEEVFGPLTMIVKVGNIDEAIKIANSSRFGLDASIFGENDAKIRKIVRYLEVGSVFINDYPRHGIGYYPFGGMKNSGIGREGIGYSVDFFTTTKSIVRSYKFKGVWEYL
ncbi:MAG: aldehyde dehydrogenase family protein, partial [Candidatus Njordarchaeales archaeon]